MKSRRYAILIVGLAGGIASGKSTIAKLLAGEEKIAVIDADQVAWETYNPGTEVYEKLVQRFGEKILDQDGSINREALGARVFANDENRLILNSIVHPAVRQRYREIAEEFEATGTQIFVIEAALLLDRESVDRDFFDLYILVVVDEDEQLKRVLSRGKWDEEEARKRISSQTPQDVKASRADYIVDTTCSIVETEEKAAELILWLKDRAEAKISSS